MYIYIITHPKFEGWIKLGRTNNLQNRLNSYQTGCPNREYKIDYFKEVNIDQAYSIEKHFNTFIKNNGYEWFNISIEEGINTINTVIENKISYIKFEDRYVCKKKINNKTPKKGLYVDL